MRFEREINIYGDEVILKRFQTNETSISVIQGEISAIISESELIELIDSSVTMYSKLASAIMDIDSLQLNFSELNTKYNTVSGQYTQLNSKLTQVEVSVSGLSANISQVSQNLSNNYSTTTQMNSAINAKANEISASVSSTYATKTALNAANGKIDELETWKSEASLKITDSAIISTVISSSSYENSVESLIEQNADSIRLKADRISWDSTYSSMSSLGTLTCRNAKIEGTIHSDNGDDEVYMRSARLDFIRDSIDVGNIGTNVNKNNNSQKGLTFDLENTGHFMSWGVRTSSSSDYYTMKWVYSRVALTGSAYPANTLNAGCDIMLQSHNLCIGADTNHRIFNYTNGIGVRSNDNIFFEIGSGSSNNRLEISSSGTRITGNSLLMVSGGSGIIAYNNTRLDFYSDLNMNGFDILNNSDERLKENILTPEVNPMELLSQVELFQYDWRDSKEHVEIGMIAQQVMEIMPKIVKQGKDGLYSMNYTGLIPYIIGAIQYLYKMINPVQTFSTNSSYVPKEYTKEEIEDALSKAAPPVEIVTEKIYEEPKNVFYSKH